MVTEDVDDGGAALGGDVAGAVDVPRRRGSDGGERLVKAETMVASASSIACWIGAGLPPELGEYGGGLGCGRCARYAVQTNRTRGLGYA